MALSRWFLIPTTIGFFMGLLPIRGIYIKPQATTTTNVIQSYHKRYHQQLRNVWYKFANKSNNSFQLRPCKNWYTIFSIILNLSSIIIAVIIARAGVFYNDKEVTNESTADSKAAENLGRIRALLLNIFRAISVFTYSFVRLHFIIGSSKLLLLCQELNNHVKYQSQVSQTFQQQPDKGIPFFMICLVILNIISLLGYEISRALAMQTEIMTSNQIPIIIINWLPYPILVAIMAGPLFASFTVPFQFAIFLIVSIVKLFDNICDKVECTFVSTAAASFQQRKVVEKTKRKLHVSVLPTKVYVKCKAAGSEAQAFSPQQSSLLEEFEIVVGYFDSYNKLLSPILTSLCLLSVCNVVNNVVNLWNSSTWIKYVECLFRMTVDISLLCLTEVGCWTHNKVNIYTLNFA